MLGRAHYGHALRLPHEEHAIVFAPPRTGKSGLLADIMLHYPGPVLSTTTRADIFKNTQHARRGRRPGRRVQPAGHRPGAQHDGLGSDLRLPGHRHGDPACRRVRAGRDDPGRGGWRVLGRQDQRLPAGVLLRRRVRPEQGRALRPADGRPLGTRRRQPGGRGDPDRRRARSTGPRRCKSCAARPRRRPPRCGCT